jgi:hypothetical protein
MSLPYITGDTYSLSNCTAALSTVKYYAGAKSLKITKTAASTAEYRFCDSVAKNDLHGLKAGKTYALSARTYLLATGSPSTAEAILVIGYTTSTAGAWHETTGNVSTIKDAWSTAATTDFEIPSGARSAKVLIRIKSAASTAEAIYVDNIRLAPRGTHNEHGQNYYDGGVGTILG